MRKIYDPNRLAEKLTPIEKRELFVKLQDSEMEYLYISDIFSTKRRYCATVRFSRNCGFLEGLNIL